MLGMDLLMYFFLYDLVLSVQCTELASMLENVLYKFCYYYLHPYYYP